MMNQNETWSYVKANSPIVMSVPHAGTQLSDSVRKKLTRSALGLIDTDWHMDKIATQAAQANASVLIAHYSRYMVDLNRPQDDKPLYKGATKGLVPTIDFDGNSLYINNVTPDDEEVQLRIINYWKSYHQQLKKVIEDTKNQYGFCLLLDCHSIRSKIPKLFDGILPDINIGTNEGQTIYSSLSKSIEKTCQQSSYSYVINGRFKGGYITRNYGNPLKGVHAVQIEIAQYTYMLEADPWTLLLDGANRLSAFINEILLQMQGFANKLSNQRERIK